jgi:(p)ppGpp synthase/HD superfamily hydrolase
MTKDEMMIRKVLNFAAIAHASVPNDDGSIGQKRKGTNIPYIVHPVEVWQILKENGCSPVVQIAGLVHDCLEDAGITAEEIEKEFNKEIREVVESESEDKMRHLSEKDSWRARKQATIDELQTASKETMMVCNADKLSNLRSMAYDLETIGEKLWERFNAPKEDIKWYYSSIAKALTPISNMPLQQELCALIDEVFV